MINLRYEVVLKVEVKFFLRKHNEI